VLDRCSADEPWNLVSQKAIPRTSSWVNLAECPEPITSRLETELTTSGLRIIRRDQVCDAALNRAWVLIGRAPSLQDVVRAVVTGVVRLQSDDDAVDISYSEPRWAGSVFVSFPPPSPVGHLRLAESIIHEAMHINLSNTGMDDALPRPELLLYSPWRDVLRPASGVLHGAYVFTCLLRFYALAAVEGSMLPEQVEHITRRQTEILSELARVPWSQLSSAIGDAGRRLCRSMHDYVGLRHQDLARGPVAVAGANA
jgi:HEXXH motif-containing protein